MPESSLNITSVQCWFVRYRQSLLATVSMQNLFADYEQHKKKNQIVLSPEEDALFRRCMAAFILHCASQPRYQHISWTLNLQDPLINVFLVGDTGHGMVAGRIFTDHVKVSSENSFYQEVVRVNKPLQRSHVNFSSNNILHAIEHYYQMSEQRPARFFQASDSEFAILAAHPDYDEGWFTHVDATELAGLFNQETISLIETRQFHWDCGCSQQRVLKVLSVSSTHDISNLYGQDEILVVKCPRCSARYIITRESMEAWLDEQS